MDGPGIQIRVGLRDNEEKRNARWVSGLPYARHNPWGSPLSKRLRLLLPDDHPAPNYRRSLRRERRAALVACQVRTVGSGTGAIVREAQSAGEPFVRTATEARCVGRAVLRLWPTGSDAKGGRCASAKNATPFLWR